ncbi:carboxypeptidase regulatory-like domain-containing protein [Siphonobacter sp.]|uniref:carboxypeptidase regulatory-like domain-containing protein n=1 Tax=Siphonobacter sp. TaxID=1869184 RepID=UPI003B3BCB1D
MCLVFQNQAKTTRLASGIRGQVIWKSGNQMPSPDRPASVVKGVKREVWIYQLTNQNQTEQQEGFYRNIRTKRVKKVVTDASGRFKVKLAPGRYSLFTKEPQGLWANLMDGQGNIFPVTVRKGKYEEIQFEINYAAVF